jgi:diacylglycerol kinase family enzyme
VLASNLGADLGVRVDPSPDAHDGQLQLTVVTTRSLRTAFAVIARLLLGRRRDPSVVRVLGHRVRITAHPAQPVHLDGDPMGSTPVELETLPAAVELVVP